MFSKRSGFCILMHDLKTISKYAMIVLKTSQKDNYGTHTCIHGKTNSVFFIYNYTFCFTSSYEGYISKFLRWCDILCDNCGIFLVVNFFVQWIQNSYDNATKKKLRLMIPYPFKNPPKDVRILQNRTIFSKVLIEKPQPWKIPNSVEECLTHPLVVDCKKKKYIRFVVNKRVSFAYSYFSVIKYAILIFIFFSSLLLVFVLITLSLFFICPV